MFYWILSNIFMETLSKNAYLLVAFEPAKAVFLSNNLILVLCSGMETLLWTFCQVVDKTYSVFT